MNMKFCYECGHKLILKELKNEGLVPYCEKCEAHRFPIFSTAVISAVFNIELNKVLLIKQYGGKRNILLAGYINKGENAETALIREADEELNLNVVRHKYIKSVYFEKTNTLMLGFFSQVDSENLDNISDEVDFAKWYTFDEAREAVAHNSIAEDILNNILNMIEKGEV